MSEREMHFSAEFGLERREEEGDAFSLQALSPLLSSSSSSAGLSRQRVLCSSGEGENIEDGFAQVVRRNFGRFEGCTSLLPHAMSHIFIRIRKK